MIRHARTPTPSSDGSASPELDDERKPEEAERDREPEPLPYRLVDVEAGPERDEHRREVLDDERDPDVEPPNADEVEELDEGEAEDPEHRQEAQLPPRRAERGRPSDRHGGHEDQRRARRPHLGQPERREARRVEHDLGDHRVQRPEDDRGPDERVAERRTWDRTASTRGRAARKERRPRARTIATAAPVSVPALIL